MHESVAFAPLFFARLVSQGFQLTLIRCILILSQGDIIMVVTLLLQLIGPVATRLPNYHGCATPLAKSFR